MKKKRKPKKKTYQRPKRRYIPSLGPETGGGMSEQAVGPRKTLVSVKKHEEKKKQKNAYLEPKHRPTRRLGPFYSSLCVAGTGIEVKTPPSRILSEGGAV